jgi:energy-converting hydrogenase Eha subunit A
VFVALPAVLLLIVAVTVVITSILKLRRRRSRRKYVNTSMAYPIIVVTLSYNCYQGLSFWRESWAILGSLEGKWY